MNERRWRVIADFFEQMTPVSLEHLGEIYAPEARFSDPFNQLSGIAEIKGLYAEMFSRTTNPGFTIERITAAPEEPAVALLVWEFRCIPPFGPRRPLSIHGASQLTLDVSGRIVDHTDFWDPLPLLERIPLVGRVVGRIRP